MPRKGALDISRAAKVFGFRPRYDLRAGLEAYVRGERRLIERRRPQAWTQGECGSVLTR
jgi:nucleoside-diphosphate-sugar epimerase